jgi:hypothetical protein
VNFTEEILLNDARSNYEQIRESMDVIAEMNTLIVTVAEEEYLAGAMNLHLNQTHHGTQFWRDSPMSPAC